MTHKGSSSLAATASAFATYSLVPYLGILFCPGAVVVGTLGVFRSYRSKELLGRGACVLSLVMGLLLLAIQGLLWWILYMVPEWAKEL